MSPDIIASTLFNGILIIIVGWLLNDKLKNMDFRIGRIEQAFFHTSEECLHNRRVGDD